MNATILNVEGKICPTHHLIVPTRAQNEKKKKSSGFISYKKISFILYNEFFSDIALRVFRDEEPAVL